MKRKKILLFLFFIVTTMSATNYQSNRSPLVQKEYTQLPLGTIQPQGWLMEQLQRMKSGLTGHLDETYSQVVGPNNAWLGGDGDAWERGPYWIDGLLPLAYILHDKDLMAKAQPWIEWILKSQQPNGQFGPAVDHPDIPGLQRTNAQDWWPRMVVLKIMQQYYSATGDPRVITFLTKYFHYQLKTLPTLPLGHWTFWGEQRGGDNLMVVYWLYNITGDPDLLKLGELIHQQTLDWTDIFLHQNHLSRQLSLHCVNLAQGFKEPIVYYQQSKDEKQIQSVKKAMQDIRHTIGLPTGLWAGDELLRFGEPTKGSELCTAVEMMFSLETMLEITGDASWADQLERITYNALPTQIDDRFESRQYFQQTNQVEVTPKWRNFSTPHEDTDILFGTLNGYPCCTCNLHQGWPKFVHNLFYATEDRGIAALIYAPATVKAQVADNKVVQITEKTAYPFDESVSFVIEYEKKHAKGCRFPINLRIPSWCSHAEVTVNGQAQNMELKAGTIVKIDRTWEKGDVLTLKMPMNVSVSRWYDGSAVVERGPLIYALKLHEKWEKKTFEGEKASHYGPWYYEVTTQDKWNFGLPMQTVEHPTEHITVIKSNQNDIYPWTPETAPIVLKTKGLPMKDWTIYRGESGSINFFTQQGKDYGESQTIDLIPYGCTTLRITEFPVRY